MEFDIVDIEPSDTAPLRRSVLRSGTPSDMVEFDGDLDDATFHLGVKHGGDVIAISTWMRRRFDARPDRVGYQLRGMATDPGHRASGYADALLRAGVGRCQNRGADLVWARARDTALGFYERRGFVVVGDGYVDATTGLPHHDVVRDLI